MKKSVLLFGLLIFLGYRNQAQDNFFMINPSLDSNLVVDLKDTLIYAYPGPHATEVYTVDMDGNHIADITITAYGDIQGVYGYASIKFETSDSCMFSIDNSVLDSSYCTVSGQTTYDPPSTFKMVKIHNLFDTLLINDDWSQASTYIANLMYSMKFPCVLYSLNNWISGEHYIGIRKIFRNINYLGWIKVEVLNYSKIVMKEYAFNVESLSTDQYKKTSLLIFPNPSTDRLTIDCGNKRNLKLQIYTTMGNSVFQRNMTSGKNELDVSYLIPGIYFVRLSGPDGVFQQKLIKK